MKYLLISGGTVEESVLNEIMEEYTFDFIIAADRGIDICHKMKIMPQLIVGDFDSAQSHILDFFRTCCDIIFLNTHKDDTDTEYAVTYALYHDADEIIIVGATGTRYDHAIANIGLLKKCTDRNIKAYIIDAHNRISMIKSDTRLYKSRYPFVSLIPYAGDVMNVSLHGFEYGGVNVDFHTGSSLGVSNSITDDYAEIIMDNGYLIVFETKD